MATRQALDRVAYPLAIEAVLGVLARGQPVTEARVREWIVAALAGDDPGRQILARAMSFAHRIIHGPLPVAEPRSPLDLDLAPHAPAERRGGG